MQRNNPAELSKEKDVKQFRQMLLIYLFLVLKFKFNLQNFEAAKMKAS